MTVDERLREGNLEDALAQAQEQVRRDPANAKHRVLLFQLLSILGQWERALTQLNVAGNLDTAALAMVQTYREALGCEVLRSETFKGRRTPLVFGEPEQWMGLLLDALRLGAEGHFAQSQEARHNAFDAAPGTSGTVDGREFQWIADADPRLGPTLEAIVNGRYYWIPFYRIHRIQIEEPADLRDLVWTPAHLTWANEGEAAGLIPTRYPDSENSEDPQVRLARKTSWTEHEEDFFVGLGQRMFATDFGEFSLMDVRDLVLKSDEETAVQDS